MDLQRNGTSTCTYNLFKIVTGEGAMHFTFNQQESKL